MIKAITFDLDGVYFTEDSFQSFKRRLPKTVTNEEVVNQVLFKSPEILAFKRGELTEDQYWDFARQSLGTTLNNHEIATLMADCYEINQSVLDTVRKVQNLGLKTCICTNNFPTRIDALNKKFNFLNDFDVQVFSYQVGAMKPDVKIFQALIEKSGCQSNEIIFADDKQSNVDAALSLGINAFLYTNFEDFLFRLKQQGIAF